MKGSIIESILNSDSIDISNLNLNGIMMVRITTDEGSIMKKVVLE